MFFRKDNDSAKDVAVDFMFSTVTGTKKIAQPADMGGLKNKLVRRPLSAAPTNSMNMTNGGRSSKSPSKMMPASASRAKRNVEEIQVPVFMAKSDEDYRKIKQAIIDMMIEYRIYKNDDLENLLAKIKAKNQHLDLHKIDEIYLLITNELDK